MEKGLPLSEEEQIKAQFPLKRSLEISVGWKQEGDSSKKLRTDEIIDVRAGMTNLGHRRRGGRVGRKCEN